ncbi:MAG: tRNA (adenosine(37)-N6)-threonylcarbamoyltransferase complex transferase subunit TsaD [Oscillospiraceae bacterium]|jgi:N6-L-threonylcarbamoyladenine synthase|nr:tRNA (adenosine(37)-N6)-threonylcarbamoyltransferase complex transferase subunit TsaD [Oscillospiraceae bacterium]
MLILGIETSCDETAVAVVKDGREILSNIVYTQIPVHEKYGGVVPEVAGRLHCEHICEVYENALTKADISVSDIDAVAVTYAPGLIGALLVGLSFAKGLAYSTNKPLVPVHHIRGHIAANYLAYPDLTPPYLCLIASGGHTQIVNVKDYTSFELLGETTDDAAGECFDKAARVLGYPYPGGKYIEAAAALGDNTAYNLPIPKSGTDNPYDFSFSGLKTAVINLAHNIVQKGNELSDTQKQNIAACFQNTVSEMLYVALKKAAQSTHATKIAVAGGVAANAGIRDKITRLGSELGASIYLPPLKLCGDNAAMIAAQGYYEYRLGNVSDLNLNAYARKPL